MINIQLQHDWKPGTDFKIIYDNFYVVASMIYMPISFWIYDIATYTLGWEPVLEWVSDKHQLPCQGLAGSCSSWMVIGRRELYHLTH